MAEEYQVKITTQGDPKGADKVAESLQKVTKSAGETGKQAQSLGNDLSSLGARNNATKDVVEGLDSALRGNAQSFFGVAKAATNLWEVLTVSTPMGRLVQLGLIAVNTFALLARRFGETGDKAKTTATDTDTATEAINRLNNAKLTDLRGQLDAVGSAMKDTIEFADKLAAISKKIDDARMNLELAQLTADSSLSPEDRKAREFEIRDRYSTRDIARERLALQERVDAAEAEAMQKRALADAAEEERDGMNGAADRTQRRLDEARAERKANRATGSGPGQMGPAVERDFQLQERIRFLESLLTSNTGADAQARRDGADARASAVRAAADKADADLLKARQLLSLFSNSSPIIASINRNAARVAAGVPEPESRGGASSTVTETLGSLAASGRFRIGDGNGANIGEEIAARVLERIRAGEQAMLEAIERRMKADEQAMKALRR
jgi:hypothetical protein